MKIASIWKSSAIVLSLLLLSPPGLGHDNDPGRATLKIKGGQVTVAYGRPLQKGRDLLSLIEPGRYWRLGADQATTLTTTVDLMLGGQRIAPGEYTLVAHFKGNNEWSLVVAESAVRRVWEPRGTVAQGALQVEAINTAVEALTIRLEGRQDGFDLIVEWGNRRLSTRFTAA